MDAKKNREDEGDYIASGRLCGGLPKWSFALEVVTVEMREVPIRALSASRLYGLLFFLHYQKT